jgi:hypothetical protein
LGGESDLNNIAPMCSQHNREKSQLSLGDFRIKLVLDGFFSTHDKPTLRHLLSFLKDDKKIKGFGSGVVITTENEGVKIDSASGAMQQRLYKCPITGWNYFYATLNVSLVDSDDETDENVGLQPRYLIKDKVFSLFRHFQRHPVLQPSIGRVAGSHIRLFDGQHKVAALLMNERNEFECKIYLDPDLRLLNQTNISAHDNFAQTRFYSSIMILKLGAEFSKDFDEFKNLDHPLVKSEEGFFNYLLNRPNNLLTKAALNRSFRSHLYSSVLDPEKNKLTKYVSNVNRSTDEQPITMDMLEKSIFACFLRREPTADNMASEAYRRDNELANMIELCNMLVEGGLHNWNPKAPDSSYERQRLQRIFGSKSMMAWSELLKDAVSSRLELDDQDERMRVFYRALSPEDLGRIRKIVLRLYDWQRWAAPKNDPIDRILSDKKSAVKDWFKAHGLSISYLLGSPD